MDSDNKTFLKDKNILIFQQRSWAFTFGKYLADKFTDSGANLYAIAMKRNAYDYLKEQGAEQYKEIYYYDDLIYNPFEVKVSEKYSLEYICNYLEVDSIWSHVACVRRLMRSYGNKYYYSYRKNASDEHIKQYIKATFQLVRDAIVQNKIDVIVIPVFVSFVHVVAALVAKKEGCKLIAAADSKVGDYFLYTSDPWFMEGDFFNYLNEPDVSKFEDARKYIEEQREFAEINEEKLEMAPVLSLAQVKRELLPYYFSLRLLFRFITRQSHFSSSLGSDIDHPSPYTVLRDHYVHKIQQYLTLKRFQYSDFDPDANYAYYPLQFQPETQIDRLGSFFNNQLEVARLIAQSLPGEMSLVIKEHPAMIGKRSFSYLQKLKALPNVKVIHPKHCSRHVVSNANIFVASPCSTLFEASLYKVPSIQLGKYGLTQSLPGVYVHTDFTTLSSKIREIIGIKVNNTNYEKKLQQWVAAVMSAGFRLDYNGLWYDKNPDRSGLEVFWQNLCAEIERNEDKLIAA